MISKKDVSLLTAKLKQPGQETPFDIDFAGNPERPQLLLGIDAMHKNFLHATVIVEALIDHPGNESDGSHLAHQARVEAQRIDPVQDGLRALRHLVGLYRVDHDKDDVG